MNILIYMSNDMIGGIRTVSEILTDGFINNGHNVYWLIHNKIYTDARINPKGYDISYLPDQEFLTLNNIEFYKNILNTKNIDIIINQDGLYGSSELIAKADKRCLIFNVIHSNPLLNSEWLFKDISTLRNNSNIEKCKRLARIILYPKIKRQVRHIIHYRFNFLDLTDSTIVFLSQKYKEAIDKFHPVHNKTVAIANPNTYTAPVLVKKEKIVLYVGRIDNRSKKIQYLIEIWNKLGNKTEGWKLMIIGEGDDIDYIKTLACKSNNIEFAGYQDPESYYQRASILCMTSLFEGFPMVLTEAMQYGCVPIAFDSFGAIYDIINSGIDGEIVKSFNKKEYSMKLLHLMEDDRYRDYLSKNSIDNIKRFNQKNIIEEWEKLFNL